MKVYEYINQLKGTNATLEQIKTWSYMNRVCPIDFREPENGLELENGIPEKFDYFIRLWCNKTANCQECYDRFFELEMPDGFNKKEVVNVNQGW